MKTFKKFFILILLSFLSINYVNAAPTVEGLLRGGANPENIYDWSVFRLKIKKKKIVTLDAEGMKVEGEESGQEAEEQFEEKHIKLIFSTKTDEPIKFIQIEYSTPSMKKEDIVSVFSSDDLLKQFEDEAFQERILFMGILLGQSSGNSQILNSILVKFNKDYRSNKDLLNQEKVDLYESYKKYLVAIKDDPDLEKTLESPLRPVDVNKFGEVQKILKQEMYQDLNQVQIFNQGNRFFWKAKLENFEGIFTLDGHRMRNVNLVTPQGMISAGAKNYRMFSSNFYLPSVLLIKDVLEETYQIEVRQYQQFGKTPIGLNDLLKNYPVPEGAKKEEKESGIEEKVELVTEGTDTEEAAQPLDNTEKFNILF